MKGKVLKATRGKKTNYLLKSKISLRNDFLEQFEIYSPNIKDVTYEYAFSSLCYNSNSLSTQSLPSRVIDTSAFSLGSPE